MTEPAPAQPDRRSTIKAELTEGRAHAAIESARLLLNEQPSILNQRFVRRLVDAMGSDASGLKLLKVALLPSFSIEFNHVP